MAKATPYEAAVEVVSALVAAGHEAWVVGGAVRDHILGHDVTLAEELDITTDATPERLCELFRRTIDVGKAFGVVRVGVRGQWTEVATFRSDGVYVDGRRPASVSYGTVEEDVKRRDFTVNGVLWNPRTNAVLDLVGGVADIEAGRIRAIGDPHARLREDGLRLLRAIRFGSTGKFALEPGTQAAVLAERDGLRAVSGERVRDELCKIATRSGSRRGDALRLLDATRLLDAVIPGARSAATESNAGVLDRLALRTLPLFLATCIRTDAIAPAQVARQTEPLATTLRLSREEVSILNSLLDSRRRYRALASCSSARQLLAATRADAELHETLLDAEGDATESMELLRRVRAERGAVRPAPLLDGMQLLRLGVPAGRALGYWLRCIRWRQLAGLMTCPDEAVAWLRLRGVISSI